MHSDSLLPCGLCAPPHYPKKTNLVFRLQRPVNCPVRFSRLEEGVAYRLEADLGFGSPQHPGEGRSLDTEQEVEKAWESFSFSLRAAPLRDWENGTSDKMGYN